MGVELTFFGGVEDYENGELGGVQGLFFDTEKNTQFFLDIGQRPDHTSHYYGFPFKTKSFQSLDISEKLDLYPTLKGIYRHDYELLRGEKIGKLPLEGILITHAHYDHTGGLTLIRSDLPVYMHQACQQILWVWQYIGGSKNQFVDIIDRFSLGVDGFGREKFLFGNEAVIHRDIRLYKENESFKIGDIDVIPYLIDHSVPGACGFILNTSAGKIGISGDIRLRGRRSKDTESFVNQLLEQKVSYLIWEGSLLHMEHNGTEDDVAESVAKIIKDKSFVAISIPSSRELDRISSLYQAAKANKRMLVLSSQEAIYLKVFDGSWGFPKLDWKYIGIYLPKKDRGLIDDPKYDKDTIKKEYRYWERRFIDIKKWKGHEAGLQRVSIEDIRDNQDQFIVCPSHHNLIEVLAFVKPKQNSIFIRSHPAPWTPEMEIQENREINILKEFKMYDGPKPDYFSPSIERKMHQIHVTGHLNRKETKEILHKFDCKIIPYHCKRPMDFVEELVKNPNQVIIPKRGEKLELK